ncbi:PREDICTED: uncharacterized protein LOC108371719 isoform X1 [Rhagoletis zephyria]|uniref:uncharacterized protein LOC108371719 isoform X1 n=1 Tax=Rhagoletis zephyria TaxID=28612 RepID=UPI0008119A94|nr:PREDICTED: uncharacterized protein LOC108371719 isoform X1 [Rhagoletis zephyria]XP_017482811.1 PREDICTED: uncharacterized protein LOC108371719 isoform X1 [Rhagoletis zephyria]
MKIEETLQDTLPKIRSAVDQLIKKNVPITTKKIFPILTLGDLEEANKEVGNEIEKYTQILKIIINPEGIFKNFNRILSDKVIHQLNYDGVNFKMAFKEYKSLNKALFGKIVIYTSLNKQNELIFFFVEATAKEGTTHKDFVKEIRNCFRAYKSRNFKKIYDKKKKSINSQ